MVYEKIYKALIDKRRKEKPVGYTETHHIIPVSFGGSNNKTNLIELTAREHFIAHYLLLKMQVKNTPQYHSMRKAFLMMSAVSPDTSLRYISSLKFSKLKEEEAQYKSIMYVGSGNSQYGTVWICNPSTKHNKKIKIDDEIPIGYYKGRNLVEKKCSCCGKVFVCLKKEKCCSSKCYENNTQSNKDIDNKECIVCGRFFTPRRMSRKTCSKECKTKAIGKGSKGNTYASKLTEDDVRSIRSFENKNKPIKELSLMFNVTEAMISYIKNNKHWKDIE